MSTAAVKRTIDLVLGTGLLICLSPLIAVCALLIWCTMGRPVLFCQQRAGYQGLPFHLFKFRTMLLPDPDRGLVSDHDRLTLIGRFLRSASLDELPQLWNVLQGDMSLVGPRPLLMSYLDRYSNRQMRRHEVKPGITGWAQIRGRNSLSWEEKLELDAWYVENRSLRLDVRILCKTLLAVVRRDGISSDGHATMPEFLGSVSEHRTEQIGLDHG